MKSRVVASLRNIQTQWKVYWEKGGEKSFKHLANWLVKNESPACLDHPANFNREKQEQQQQHQGRLCLVLVGFPWRHKPPTLPSTCRSPFLFSSLLMSLCAIRLRRAFSSFHLSSRRRGEQSEGRSIRFALDLTNKEARISRWNLIRNWWQ